MLPRLAATTVGAALARTTWLAAATSLGGCAPTVATAETLTGAIRIGQAQSYAVILDASRETPNEIHVKIAVSQGEQPFGRIFVRLRPKSGTATFQGRDYPVPPEQAALWWAQLATPSPLETQVALAAAGLPGKLYVKVSPGRLRELRFFSLEEWNNSFGDYVSLGLSQDGREP
jgi:hypothetical protein